VGLADKVRSFLFGDQPPITVVGVTPPDTRSAKGKIPGIGGMNSGGAAPNSGWGVLEPRRGAKTMRRFSETNVWVRIAINRRKREISRAKWSIIRVDDSKAKPRPKVVKECSDLFNYVNDTRISINWLLNMLVEDILVVDAGCIEHEHDAGGKIVALWHIDGCTIMPLSTWSGKPNNDRYVQIYDGKVVARFKNDELTYMMQNPRTCSVVGLSPLEVLFDTVEADLYGSDLEYRMMLESAPPGMLYLGSGISPEQVEQFRTQWENEIAGNRDIAMFGGGASMDGERPQPPLWIPFGRSGREEQRREYMKWLATKVAGAFEMDLLAFNLSETVHRSIGEAVTSKTDDGLLGLAGVIEDFITREIIWELDPNHEHGFQFMNLIRSDEMVKAKTRAEAMMFGYATPNQYRVEDGLDPHIGSENDPEHWANLPYPFNMNVGAVPAEHPFDPPAPKAAPVAPVKKPTAKKPAKKSAYELYLGIEDGE
jgi:hypothetical protein